MPARTGAEYIAGLQERAAEVYLHGGAGAGRHHAILHLLGASSLMAIPTEADLQGPLAAEIHSYLDTATTSAEERIRLFRLAWDTCCSAFASRQVLYERYFGGDALRTAIILYGFYDRTPMMNWVRECLEQP